MKSRFIKFLITLLLVIGAAEVFVRANGPYFSALSDKLLLKTAILKRSPETKILFLGTSRFVDSIDQKRFTTELEAATGLNLKCLNGATTGSQGKRTAYFAKIAVENKNLTHVILEASPPSLSDGELGFPDENAAEPDPIESSKSNKEEPFATRFENDLQRRVTKHIGLVKYRKALRPKTLLKLPVLFMADTVDPNTWSRKGVLRNLFTSSKVTVTDEIAAQFVPTIVSKKTLKKVPKPIPPNKRYDNLVRFSEIFVNSGIEVIWVAPPVSEEKVSSSSGRKFTRLYESIAYRYDTIFYDYAGLATDSQFRRDPSHLNGKGRHVFTTLLARQLADHFKTQPE